MRTMIILTTLIAATPSLAVQPCFFLDFDEDGVAEYEIIDRVDLGELETATLYVGIDWPGYCGHDGTPRFVVAEYQVLYEGDVSPACTMYAEPGAPVQALSIGNLFNGGWMQTGNKRDACPEFIAAVSVVGTGSPQTFDLAITSEPYAFPGLLTIIDNELYRHEALVMNNAACNADPNPVAPGFQCDRDPEAALASAWGSIKSLFR